MESVRVDQDEYEATIADLSRRKERRHNDVVTITGNHEDFGRVTLRREENVFTITADDLTFVRPWGVPMSIED